MVGDVVAAEREGVFVVRPIALHQLYLKVFLLEEALLVGNVNRRFAGQADITDADFVWIGGRGPGVLLATGQD